MERNPTVRIIPAKNQKIRLQRIGIYARVSTAGKAQLRNLAAQISGLTRYVAKQEGWLLTDIYMDVDSAKTGSDRREFTRLLTDCKNHDLDYVITKSLSRFGRDNVEVLKAVRMLQESAVKDKIGDYMNNCKIEIGEDVNHREYGSGSIYKITEKNVFVKFDKKQRKRRFPYPKAFEEGSLVIIERKENVVPKPSYPDIVPTHPELSDEELEKLIDEELEKAKKYTEWPDI